MHKTDLKQLTITGGGFLLYIVMVGIHLDYAEFLTSQVSWGQYVHYYLYALLLNQNGGKKFFFL